MFGGGPSPAFIALALGGVTLMVALIWFIATMNRFVRLRNLIRESWSGIDVQLRRRHDLIPNLVETVKAYAAHEQELFRSLAEARERAVSHLEDLGARVDDERAVSRELGRVMARIEAYPDLKASAHFMQLQTELANTEDRIAAARRFYNANVREYNALLESFPAGAIGSGTGHRQAEYFELDGALQRELPDAKH